MNKYQYKVQGVDYDVEIEEVEGNVAKVIVNGIHFDVEMKQPINPSSTSCPRRYWFCRQGSSARHDY